MTKVIDTDCLSIIEKLGEKLADPGYGLKSEANGYVIGKVRESGVDLEAYIGTKEAKMAMKELAKSYYARLVNHMRYSMKREEESQDVNRAYVHALRDFIKSLKKIVGDTKPADS